MLPTFAEDESNGLFAATSVTFVAKDAADAN